MGILTHLEYICFFFQLVPDQYSLLFQQLSKQNLRFQFHSFLFRLVQGQYGLLFQASGDYPESMLHSLSLEEITSKDVYDAAVQGDRLGNEVFAFTGRLLGESCADFATFSDPDAFIFFGGLTKAGDLLMNPIVKTYNETVFDNYKGTARFLISQLKDAEAALLGAAALAWTDR